MKFGMAPRVFENRLGGRAYNLSGHGALPLAVLVGEVAAALRRRRLIVPVPMAPIVAALVIWNALGRAPLKVEQVRRIAGNRFR